MECGILPTEVILRGAVEVAPETPSDPEYAAAVAQLLRAPPVGHTLAVGDVIDDYRLVELLGEGGMGVVFRAIHTRLDKEVALKVIRGARALDPQAADRFRREMKATGKLHHPNLIRATDAGVTDGVQYLVMEYIPGVNLARLILRDGPLPLARACELVRQAALGLHHAHEHGLVHRDVKPSNLLFGTDGIVRVLDLGLARLPDEAPDSAHPTVGMAGSGAGDETLTSPDQQLGTRDYTAPEQLIDSHRVDRRADVYGLGCTLVYLLTGSAFRPHDPLPPQLPPDMWAKFLAHNPDTRFPTALAAAEALAAICAPLPTPTRRRRGWVVPAALAVVLAVAVGAVLLMNKPGTIVTPDPGPNQPPEQARVPEIAPPPRAVPAHGMLPMSAAQRPEIQKHWAEHIGKPVVWKNSIGMSFAVIPPGVFAMSKDYTVTLTKPYLMGTTEVTFGQYAQFVAAHKYKTAAEYPKVGARFRTWRPLNEFPFPQQTVHRLSPGWGGYTDDQPIGYVTWGDIDEFLAWLSEKEGRKYRLPTHAEWVWACRAGTSNRVYWDNGDGKDNTDANKYAWLRNSGADRPRPVGKLLPNAWGLHDMIGNVEELVQDYVAIEFTPAGHATDPTGPDKGDTRVTCGRSYYDMYWFAPPSEWVGYSGRNVVYSNQGFRVVLEP
jgi:serine/threonine protein kinase